MKFVDKYTLDKNKEGEDKKIQISLDAFAIGDMIQELINKIEQTRTSLNG